MELQPYYGEQVLAVTNISVRVRAGDRKRIMELVAKSQAENLVVNSETTFDNATRHGRHLKAAEKEIHEAKRAAKKPFEAVLDKLEEQARTIAAPVVEEQARVIELMKVWVAKLEAEREEQQKKIREQKEAEERAHQAQIREMMAKQQEAERRARAAEDEAARLKAAQEAAQRQAAIEEAERLRSLELEVAAMTQEPVRGIVPGGSVSHPWKYRLINAEATVKAGAIRLLRIELDKRACDDAVRAQLDIAPDHEPSLPGIEVTRDFTIHIKAGSK